MTNTTKSFADNPPPTAPTVYATPIEVHAVPVEAILSQPATDAYYAPADQYNGGQQYNGGPQYNGGHQGFPVMAQHGEVARNNTGTCRRCGVTFTRPYDAHDSSAQFYRCERCARVHLEDFCIVA